MQTKGADKAQENFRHNLAQADRQTGFKYPPILKSNEGQVCSENGGKVKQRQEVEGGVWAHDHPKWKQKHMVPKSKHNESMLLGKQELRHPSYFSCVQPDICV